MDQFSEAEVTEALAPYHGRIMQAVVAGFKEWLVVADVRSKQGFSPILYPRTVTNYVFDAIARNARSMFGLDTTVRVFDESQTVKFCFNDKVIGRFKKGDEDNLGKNITTQAVLDFVGAQQVLPGLPPEAAKVEFLWAANDIGTYVERVMVVARDGDSLLWSYEIDVAADDTSVVHLHAPDGPDSSSPLIKPKIASDKIAKDN
jgi:hypothetical protein